MATLSEELATFALSIVRGEVPSAQISTSVINYPLSVGLEVYRNNFRGNLHDTLAGAYPVIEKLVGKEFFSLLTRQFIDQYGSHSGNLHHYGAQMSRFVHAFEPAHELQYLADIAALEWACHCAYFAEDNDSLDLGKLAQVPPDHYSDLVLHLHLACQLVCSGYPIVAIWQAHQSEDFDFKIDLQSGGCNALVSRKNDCVVVEEISVADAHWLEQIQRGVSLGMATSSTLQKHAEFDLQTMLKNMLERTVLVDFNLKENSAD